MDGRRIQGGLTLIELMITLAIAGLLLMAGLPSFSEWIRNAQIRGAAESILSGVTQARLEAIRRNAAMRFSLTGNLGSSCSLDAGGTAWVVSQFPVAGLCHKPTDTRTSVIEADFDESTNPLIAMKSSLEAADKLQVESRQRNCANSASTFGGSLVFTGLGQIEATGNPHHACAPGAGLDYTRLVAIEVQSASGGCQHADGKYRCLRVEVLHGGQIKLCDPLITANGDPRRCILPGPL